MKFRWGIRAYIERRAEERAVELVADTINRYIDNPDLLRIAAAAHAADETMANYLLENSMLIPPMRRAIAAFARNMILLSPALSAARGEINRIGK